MALHVLSVYMKVLTAHLYVWKGHANDEVAGPVAAASQSNGCWPRSLAEQFSHNEPRDGTGTDLKEAHEQEDGCQAHVAHPPEVILEGKSTSVKRDSFLSECFLARKIGGAVSSRSHCLCAVTACNVPVKNFL